MAPKMVAQFDREALHQLRHQLVNDAPEISHDMSKLRYAALELACLRSGYSAEQASDIARQGLALFLHHRQAITLYPDTLDQLTRLSQHYPLAALTNGNADLSRVGLQSLFNYYLNPAQVGAAKPDPRMFHALCQQSGYAPEEILHIGDCPKNDLAGALDAGMQALWLNRRGLPTPDEARHYLYAEDLIQATQLILR